MSDGKCQMNKDKSLRVEGAKSRTKLRFVNLFQIEQGAWGKDRRAKVTVRLGERVRNFEFRIVNFMFNL